MWEDWIDPARDFRGYRPFLRFDEPLWNDLTKKMAAVGMNMVVIDLGDGVQYESHPEIAVKGAWPVAKLKTELARLRKMGLEPIPKLNFSTAHDAWMGPYQRMVSTAKYYTVCRDLITEVAALFDKPRFFHIGMDEEDAKHQKSYSYVVVRQLDLWWHDLKFLVDCVGAAGSRSWIWSDYVWDHAALFYERMPKSVLQSNWYYGTQFNPPDTHVKVYDELAAHGFDQAPAASNHGNAENFGLTVDYCRKNLPAEKLLGFLQTPWRPTLEAYRKHHMEAIEQVGAAIAKAL